MLIGLDIGGTKCAVVLGRPAGTGIVEIIDKTVLPTRGPVHAMIESLFATADVLLDVSGHSQAEITGVGISCGGPLDSRTGVILSPPNLPGWDNIPITTLAHTRFNAPALLQNDANACAVAEWQFGAGRGCDNVVFLTFGTGMGAGLILDGRLYSGRQDAAGEAGHIRLADHGPVGFGKAGSFEGFCSGGGIAQLAQARAMEQLQMGRSVSFCKSVDDLRHITAKSVAEAAESGDAVATDIYETCGRYLGRGLATIIDLLNPEVIIIGGIYTRVSRLLDFAMRRMLAKEALPASLAACRIVPAALGEAIGDYAALSLAAMARRPR